ncbi:hypothetical protein [Candidatus Thiodictyon syntrophicum]|jgi:hypothetical protein|uniref:Uncharacterized protein n=1 Tax=Candidatus Thiodictyon syntrophicum TaxID=1166950 RepID=A0A2K8UDT7_9GAMM|nr:hypothetical protein [Candidatus Thiodictyon syntrophicum]AUB83763.1 hypothetical protein THSYN_24275 [Candidatus Thiodictyon syntrophicum]
MKKPITASPAVTPLAAALAALDAQDTLRAKLGTARSAEAESAAALQHMERTAADTENALAGYRTSPDRYAHEITTGTDIGARVQADIAMEGARLEAHRSEVARLSALLDNTAATAVTPAILAEQRTALDLTKQRVDTLRRHCADLPQLHMPTCPAKSQEMKTELEDLLAAQLLGEDVSARLAEVTAELAQDAKVRAQNDNEVSATLAGLNRLADAAEAALERDRGHYRDLVDAFLRSQVAAAAERYELLAEQTAAALIELQALDDARLAGCKGAPFGLVSGYLTRVSLPRVSSLGAPLLSADMMLERVPPATAAVRAEFGI